MSVYRNILVAIDFSDETGQVINKARELSLGRDSRLNLIHVVEYSPYLFPPDTPLPVDLNLDEEFHAMAETRLQSLLKSEGLSEAEWYVESGAPTQEIVRVAREREVDLIVLGSHGRHGIQRILGSTASGVLHTADCDVLAVRIREAS